MIDGTRSHLNRDSVGPWTESRPIRRVLMTCDAVGGVWTYACELARALADHQVDVLVAAMGPAPSTGQIEEIAALDHVQIAHADFALEWMDSPWEEVERAGEWLLRLASDFEPDVIHLNGFAHADLPWPAPVLVVAHSCVLTWWRAVKGERAPQRYREYIRRVSETLRSAFVVTPTEAFRGQLASEYGIKPRGMTISNARSCCTTAVPAKEPFVLSAGRLWDDAKNLALLDTVAPALDWPVLVAGNEELTGSGQFTSCNLRLLGKCEPARMAQTMARASIYAAPALYEPFGLAILEAALHGCALVLSDIPTLREVWSGCAEFAPPKDPSAWRRALGKLIADPRRREQMQHRARQAAAVFSVQKQSDAYMNAYRSLLQTADRRSEMIAA